MIQKRYTLHLLLLCVLFTHKASAQFYNAGAPIHVQSGGSIYVSATNLVNTSNGANVGTVDNYGEIRIVNGGFTNSSTATATLRNGSTLRMTGNFTNTSTLTAENTSLVHFDGAGATTPGVQQVRTNLAASAVMAAASLPATNVFGRVLLTTPGLDMSGVAGQALAVTDHIDFSNTGMQANIIDLGGSDLVLGSNASYNNSIVDIPGAASPNANHQREMVVGGDIVHFTSAGRTLYQFPLGGTNGPSGRTLQSLRITTSGNVTPDVDRFVASWQPAKMPNITVSNCLSTDNQLMQWTGTWAWEAFRHNTGTTASVPALTGGREYNINLRSVDANTGGNAAGTVIVHGTTAIPTSVSVSSIAHCTPPDPYDLSSQNPMTSFSSGAGYTISPTPLPVENLRLRASEAGDFISLNWSTSSEINSSHYILERSLDGLSYTAVSQNIAAAGFTDNASFYKHNDHGVSFNTTYYYRVQQYDLDGASSTSNVVQAMLTAGNNGFRASFMPNPATNTLRLSVFSPRAQTVTYRMYDYSGKLVVTNTLEVEQGSSTVDASHVLNRLATGTYAIVLEAGGEQIHQRLAHMKGE
ncbi:MAG: T9SS type A sorting domain-containing protein [Sphingobacteriia bacterium]